MKANKIFLLMTLFLSVSVSGGNGPTYTNPILHSDYSDPDAICVDGEFWMTSSSFNCVPGLQVLHSKDLINWEIVSAALPGGPESYWPDASDRVRHGDGVYAPSIRYHDGMFYIFWGDPDYGIYQVHTTDPAGVWSDPVLVLEGKGFIDTCPLWDDDGKVYLVHGWAGSRFGFNSMLSVCEMNEDCTAVKGEQILVFDGNKNGNGTVEGPKFYKRDGWYYIFAPAGGVKDGWQLVLRSRNIYGPYEHRVVMNQGSTDIHGPHQGAWITDAEGDDWFLHFEDRYAYGRVVHLQPLKWNADGWCIIGEDKNGDGIGEPVLSYRKPKMKSSTPSVCTDAMETRTLFKGTSIPLNWQWQAQPRMDWCMMNPADGCIRLHCVKKGDGWKSLWDTPNMLLEKIAGQTMSLTAKLVFRPAYEGDRCGLAVMGENYSSLDLCYIGREVRVVRHECQGASAGKPEAETASVALPGNGSRFYTVYLKLTVREGCICDFFYSTDGKTFAPLGESFKASAGKWIGAKAGFYAIADIKRNSGGSVEVY